MKVIPCLLPSLVNYVNDLENNEHVQWNVDHTFFYSQQTLHTASSQASYGVFIVSNLEKHRNIIAGPHSIIYWGSCDHPISLLFVLVSADMTLIMVLPTKLSVVGEASILGWITSTTMHDGSVQDCSISSALAMEILQSSTKSSKWW